MWSINGGLDGDNTRLARCSSLSISWHIPEQNSRFLLRSQVLTTVVGVAQRRYVPDFLS